MKKKSLPRSSTSEQGSNAKAERPAPDPFDPARLRLAETSQIGVQKVQTVIACCKPNRQQFVRVHPSEEYRMETALFTDEVKRT